jgi:hypothetical protein
MAQKVIVTMADDIDGIEGDDVRTYHFALERQVFKIDLRPGNYQELRKALDPFISNAQAADPEYRRTVSPVNGSSARRITHVPPPRDRASRDRAARIRNWARKEGRDIGEKGRIPGDIERDYDAAHASVV